MYFIEEEKKYDRYWCKRGMKVLFVTRGFPSEKDPMPGNYEAVQAKAIAAKGHDVSVITIRWISLRKLSLGSRISHRSEDGVDVYECTRICISNRFNFLYALDKYLRKREYNKIFHEYVRDKGMPDIVHAHIVFCAAPVVFLKDKYNLPFVITEHWSKAFKSNVSVWTRKQALVYHRADQIICVSQALADSLFNKFQVNSVVINNMVSDLFFKSKRNNRDGHNFLFVAVGAFREDRLKGFDILIEAFAKASLSERVNLDIVGDGPDRHFIESKILQYGLEGRVRLLGVKTPEEVSHLLCDSDCYVLSSRLETFAIVVIEAMAKGLPVIATKCGGPETYLRPEHGILVENENVDQLAEAMNYMSNHNADFNSNEIRNYCYSHFSQDIVANQIIDIYNKVIKDKSNHGTITS